MERLTKRFAGIEEASLSCERCGKNAIYECWSQENCTQTAVDRLASIEDILGDTYDLDRLRELVEADKAGRCVLHPLKAENEVYIAILGRVLPFEVTNAVWYSESPTYKAMHGIHLCFVFKQDDIGKTVFLTRESAESALAKEADHE